MRSKTDITGMTAAVLRRSSSRGQATSTALQSRTVESVVAERRLNVVREWVLEGVTGSMPGARTDVEEVIAFKRGCPDLRLLVVPDVSRFTRAGGMHGSTLLYDLRAAGVLVYYVTEDLLVEDDLTYQFAVILFHAAHQTALAISRGATRGRTESYLEDRSVYCGAPPIGLDRIYWVEGKPRHVLRNMPDGTQLMLHPVTREVIGTFGVNPARGGTAHYRKQQNERITLTEGSPEAVATVHLVMMLRHVDKLSFYAIAKTLNDRGVLSATGGMWTAGTVADVCRNPAYLGLGVRGRREGGKLYRMSGKPGASEPEEASADFEELANRRKVKLKWRPREHWKVKPMPHLEEFLPEQVRRLAKAEIEAYLTHTGDPTRPKRANRPDKHRESTFLLKGLMTSRQGGHPMTGRVAGKKGQEVRQYAVARGYGSPVDGSRLTGRINAEAAEAAVLGVLLTLLAERPRMRDAVEASLRGCLRDAGRAREVAVIDREVRQLRRQLAALSDGLGADEDGDDPVLAKMNEVRRKIARAEAERKAALGPGIVEADVGRMTDEVMSRLTALGQTAGGDRRENESLRALLRTFVSSLVADLESREVEVEFALPSWFPEAAAGAAKVGLTGLTASKFVREAHPEGAVPLGSYRCVMEKRWRMPPCYRCSRSEERRRAA